ERRGSALFWLIATFALGLLFVVLHINEWRHLALGGFTLGSNVYATGFYGLTGVHTAHVVVGLLIHLLLFGVVASGLMKVDRITFYRGAALYWHFVDIMWLLVALNVYVIGGSA
ncbi:MAG TPA: cytochrome c oxidase subunit 3, partial [Arenicellales bacterium]|nr:cytochrome c oxidase subunit 3 [Arenicellales bacterium]